MDNIPISEDIIESLKKATGILSPGTASIREIVALVNRIEKETGIRFVRMEMGVPGLPAPEIGINAEIEALKSGVGSLYPDITGLRSLKEEASRFIKLFLDIDISPGGCIPTVGSMMGSMICFLVANRNDRTKEGSLFIDPGFRGKKLRDKLESLLETGKVSSLIYSNPNNPTWICLTEEELSIIGELCRKYDVIAIEDLAYFGMDFRKDYLNPGEPPFQPTVARYTDDYVLLISSSKIFSYAGQRIAIMAISDSLFNRSYPDLLRYYSSDKFGHSVVFGALYGISAGVSHSVQYGFSALLKAVNDGTYRFRDDIIEYGEKAKIMKELFTGNGFTITYDKDIDQPIADGFYFTISYPGMTASELIDALIPFGISAITLNSTGSERKDGLRACVSQVPRSLFSDLEHRLKSFRNKYPVK